jgi:hypothetical protein
MCSWPGPKREFLSLWASCSEILVGPPVLGDFESNWRFAPYLYLTSLIDLTYIGIHTLTAFEVNIFRFAVTGESNVAAEAEQRQI